jgi:hypothetical protein
LTKVNFNIARARDECAKGGSQSLNLWFSVNQTARKNETLFIRPVTRYAAVLYLAFYRYRTREASATGSRRFARKSRRRLIGLHRLSSPRRREIIAKKTKLAGCAPAELIQHIDLKLTGDRKHEDIRAQCP